MLAGGVIASPRSWNDYTDSLQDKMQEQSISTDTINKIFSQIKYLSHTVSKDSSQAEFIKTFENYYSKRITERRIEAGKIAWEEHRLLLNRAYKKFGIHPRYLLSFWGLETNYGKTKGNNQLLSALTSLAFDGRRRTFFEKQLFAVTRAIDKKKLPLKNLTGSWAGAFGHFQFMPTTYESYAIDGNGDGKIDLVNNIPDAVFSAGNYLSKMGWDREKTWGREVIATKNFDWKKYKEGEKKPLKDWDKLGIRKTNKQRLPRLDIEAKLIVPQGSNGALFLVYDNFNRIMKWNRSTFYAITVGRLADRIIGYSKLKKLKKEKKLTDKQVKKAQEQLKQKGFYRGKIDGIIGKGMRKAIRDFEIKNDLPVNGNMDSVL